MGAWNPSNVDISVNLPRTDPAANWDPLKCCAQALALMRLPKHYQALKHRTTLVALGLDWWISIKPAYLTAALKLMFQVNLVIDS